MVRIINVSMIEGRDTQEPRKLGLLRLKSADQNPPRVVAPIEEVRLKSEST
jgi:hypothetical protein